MTTNTSFSTATQIAELKGRIGELVRTKEAVEQSVRSVLGDNEALSRALDQLSRAQPLPFLPRILRTSKQVN